MQELWKEIQKSLEIGALIRDSERFVMAALSSKTHGNLCPRDAEAFALRLSLSMGFRCWSSDTLRNFCLFHSSLHKIRTANKAAYGLAKHALGITEDIIWLEDIPPPLVSVLISDSIIR
ncbi:hypothetical protein TIFTF001_043064 [Ficus carica]|uniref:RNase H type-1 domain-containing protein n=1 Tax=Ficus carica TaxID=3494 RepID=A0AA88CKT2_FICCA|nr:hypothetical protein TIFTF001_043064 [Ficus carica]